MEPRPQRPRAQAGQTSQGARPTGPAQPTQAFPPGEYPENADPTSFIAPARTEYDYSPLDLAPPGQRRRRQLVAAAVGGLSVLLVAAILFFSYLLLRDEEAPSENDDLLAAQTQIANDAATVSANQTIVAQAAAEQTEEAQALNPEATGESTAEDAPATEGAEAPATEGADTPATEGADTPATEGSDTADTPDLSGNASLDEAGLTALLPAADLMPETLTETSDSTRSQEQVLEALGGSRTAETNLDAWGWSGNVERTYTPVDPASADAATTGNIIVSIHGFGSPDGAAEALTYFSDILVDANGYTELEAPELGDSARLLTMTDEAGQTYVALYVQDGSVMYRIGGYSAAGDPAQDVIDVATAMLGG